MCGLCAEHTVCHGLEHACMHVPRTGKLGITCPACHEHGRLTVDLCMLCFLHALLACLHPRHPEPGVLSTQTFLCPHKRSYTHTEPDTSPLPCCMPLSPLPHTLHPPHQARSASPWAAPLVATLRAPPRVARPARSSSLLSTVVTPPLATPRWAARVGATSVLLLVPTHVC
jgi:hypothetical protein